MIDKVISTVRRYNMIPVNSKVIVALSGGSDSMALLSALISAKNELGIKSLCAAHVNHCLRGKEADDDEAFVVDFCNKNDVEVHTLKADVAAIAKEKGLSFEEAGREVRYSFFSSLGDENSVIATAHNADDRAETFLFNFTRGSSLRGLCSIPPTRGNIIRPLIDCSKREILNFCESNSIPFVTDRTNADVSYSRNRIRHNVITELSVVNPSFVSSAVRCIEAVNEDEAYLSAVAKDLVSDAKRETGYDALTLFKAPLPIMKRAVVQIVESETGITPENNSLKKICSLLESGGVTVINGSLTVRVRKGILDFPSSEDEACSPVELINGENTFFGKTVLYKKINKEETDNLQNVFKGAMVYFLDCGKINGKIYFRSRSAGDRITLKSRKCTKSLKKLFNELEIPPEKRNSVAVFCDDSGVVAVEGCGVDARIAPDNNTKETAAILILK